MTAIMCPVCLGKLLLPANFYLDLAEGEIEGKPQVCRTCQGIGVLWSSDFSDNIPVGLSGTPLKISSVDLLSDKKKMRILQKVARASRNI